jgi:hypothetical protein
MLYFLSTKIRKFAMTNNTRDTLEIQAVKGTKVEAVFDEQELTGDFGALLLREVENHCNIISNFSSAIDDKRNESYIEHKIEEICMQRILQICQGYEDADDCDHFRGDAAIKTAVGRKLDSDNDLASQPTMSRLENNVSVKDLFRIGYALIDNFLNSYATAPEAIVIDMDPSASHCHGAQQLALFNKHEDEYCLMPFHVYEGLTGKLITTVIRPGKTPLAHEIIAVLKRIVRKVRKRFPDVLITFRADSHHSKPDVHEWCEENQVQFIIGQSPNEALKRQFAFAEEQGKLKYQRNGNKPCRVFASGYYQASTWSKPRRIICRVIVSALGIIDTRYIVTSFEQAGATYLYDTIYCGRGKAELYIKDHKNALSSDRTSCHKATANQFRLFLHGAAYQLMHSLRENLLKGSELENAQFDTIRQRLLKVAARVVVMKTKITFHLPKHFPLQHLYFKANTLFMALKT